MLSANRDKTTRDDQERKTGGFPTGSDRRINLTDESNVKDDPWTTQYNMSGSSQRNIMGRDEDEEMNEERILRLAAEQEANANRGLGLRRK